MERIELTETAFSSARVETGGVGVGARKPLGPDLGLGVGGLIAALVRLTNVRQARAIERYSRR